MITRLTLLGWIFAAPAMAASLVLSNDPATGGPIMDAAGNMMMFTTPRPDFKHGNIVFFSPSLSYLPTPGFRFTVSPSVRMYEPLQGPSPAWTLDVSVQHTF